MNICVVGAGNIGTYLASYMALNEENKVWLHTSKKELFSGEIQLIEEEKNLTHLVKLHKVVDNYKEGIENADLILVTYPSFMIPRALEEINIFIKRSAIIGVIPGFGGAEFYREKFLEKGCIFFGSQRVPSITRLKEYGKSVYLKEKNPFMNIATFPRKKGDYVADLMTSLIHIKCNSLETYLGITLSPSNPIFHPSRLYELFKNYEEGVSIYEKNYLFYEEWGNFASECLLKLDEELEKVTIALMGDNLKDFERIKSRFNIEKPEELTQKIRTAPGFIGINTPMKKVEEGYIPDVESRYFIEDLQYGTCIIKGFAESLNVETPLTDEIIEWAQKLLKKDYIRDGKLVGIDSHELLTMDNMNINSREEILRYYK
ncbi:NAD/NADP-dependent octopine/nopaline dehydrogenase family protein [uncultured Clostridium sp.]|uniref:NAD/NADP-dependent octopine/nopaline dehydrogenase family protein n=1 Tax=uncultured Clostridium sp. TaxID=59620 RepID=UPI0026303665|nr:NAD/NADP-dependent octopine/nopaline dehydrogenase family protein [uncultured Clostridium sp.]